MSPGRWPVSSAANHGESYDGDNGEGGYVVADEDVEPLEHDVENQDHQDRDDDEEDGSEEESFEEDRDLQGRRHVDVDLHQDRQLVTDPSSLFTRFAPHGEESESKLRDYLQTRIPAQLVSDEYGLLLSIEDISTTHIAALQAKLWREVPKAKTDISLLSVDDISEHDRSAADTVALIADTLEMNYVFVLRNRPLPIQKCSFAYCEDVHDRMDSTRQLEIVALEPVVGFATLERADDLDLFEGHIFVFRRINDIFSEYGVDVESLLPTERIAYCIECLHHLWHSRVTGWTIKEWDRGLSNGHGPRAS
ncbi:hypothetical protein K505DRAFT_369375 [Melanomma pulvis-pyrius CBS 109.77]|uniref:Uncharacterized protein n=1 Tax=Melanomma pulvis-pyrius CBS 109.77 TaxID=1314802 RepID=A0A6A6WNG1_9PLEO|nr:hypothetical protein K505DRAFT_369375 [Melanomma pulvis-pyrius CBS 109.77]